jgi:hypothetical protein
MVATGRLIPWLVQRLVAKEPKKRKKLTNRRQQLAGEANYLFLRASSIKRAINGGI